MKNISSLKRHFLIAVIAVVVTAVFMFSLGTVFAWTGPTSAPPNGNVAAPLNASNTIQTKTGGLNLATSAGMLVGIGTASPSRLLTLNGPSTSYLGFSNAGTLQSTIGNDSNGDFFIFDDNTSTYRMVVNTSGNVGIAQTAPSARLVVNNPTTAGKAGSAGDAIYAYANSTNAAVSAEQANALGWAGFFSGRVSATEYCISGINCITSWPAGGGGGGWTDSGTIVSLTTSTDNVGIGTSSPVYKFQVDLAGAGSVGMAGLYNPVAAANNSSARLDFNANRLISGRTGVASIDGMITDITDTAYKGALIFNTANNAAPAERMRINYLGNVGIGTATPENAEGWNKVVDIRGTGHAKSIVTTATIQTGVWSHDTGFFGAPAGGIAGTKSIHPFSLITSGASRLTIQSGGNVDIAGTLTIGGGTGKINVGTIDPLYFLDGRTYATYVSGMTGVREETTGVVRLEKDLNGEYSYAINFASQETGSDLWIFQRIIDAGPDMEKLAVLLTSDGGRVWYKKDSENNRLAFYGDCACEVSYRLTAPRFDYLRHPNIAELQDGSGFRPE